MAKIIETGAASSAPSKKSEVKQMPLTFKVKNELEMELYSFLKGKLYRGAFIKEVLLSAMFKERPDLAIKYNVSIPIDAPQQNHAAAYTGQTQTDSTQHKGESAEPPSVYHESMPAEEPEPVGEDAEPGEDVEEEDSVTVTRGMNTLSMF